MKKILFLALLSLSIFSSSNGQAINDSSTLRQAINTFITSNNSRAITGEILNRILNGQLTVTGNLSKGSVSTLAQKIDSIYISGGSIIYKKAGQSFTIAIPVTDTTGLSARIDFLNYERLRILQQMQDESGARYQRDELLQSDIDGHTYELTQKLPINKTITVNGVAKNLKDNPVFTIAAGATVDTLPLSQRITENGNSIAGLAASKQNTLGFTPVPDTRNVTINGVTKQLNADASFVIGANSLQAVTDVDSVTSHILKARGLVLSSPVSQNMSAGFNGALAGGNVIGGFIQSNNLGSIAFGNADSGTIRATGKGSNAYGYSDAGINIIEATQGGAFARGNASYGGTYRHLPSIIRASAQAATASGQSWGGTIETTGVGAFTNGTVQNSGVLRASNYGSFVNGYVQGNGNNETMGATGVGSFVQGFISNNAVGGQPAEITASGTTASIFGGALGRGRLLAGGNGAQIRGYVQKKALIQTTQAGAYAGGFASDSTTAGDYSWIKATGIGAFAQGYAGFTSGASQNIGYIEAGGRGAFAYGYSAGGFSSIGSFGDGSTATGYANAGGVIRANGAGAFVSGYSNGLGDSVYAGGTASMALGQSVRNYGNFSYAYGFNILNTNHNTWKAGWNKDYLTLDGNTGLNTLGVVTNYAGNFHSLFTNFSAVDKSYVDSTVDAKITAIPAPTGGGGGDTRPYKSFVAKFLQTGTDAPILDIKENQLGAFTVSRISEGIYHIIFAQDFPAFTGYFTPFNTVAFDGTGELHTTNLNFGGNNILEVTTRGTDFVWKDLNGEISIEARVYTN